MKEKGYEFDEINLLQILKVLLRKWWLVLICAVEGALVFFLVTYFFITPQYTASAKLYVNNSTSIEDISVKLTSSDLSASRSLLDTYAVILKTRRTLEEVIEAADLPYSYEKLVGMISATDVDGTEIMKISVTSSDPEEARLIANTIVEVLPKQISKIMHGSTVEVVDLAVTPKGASSPSYKKNILLGFMIGFMISAALVLLLDMVIYDKIEESSWLSERFQERIPVLVTIPDAFAKKKKGRYGGYYYREKEQKASSPEEVLAEAEKDMFPGLGRGMDFVVSEAYNRLRTNVEFACPRKDGVGRVIGVTSSCPQEGKSFNAINLAYALAKDGYQVLLLDSDMRRPSISEKLKLEQSPGLSNILSGKAEYCTHKSVLDKNLSVITAGDIPPNPSELIGSERMEKVIALLSKSYDFVIVDLPPVGSVTDPTAISGFLDGMILVVRHKMSRRRDVTGAVRELEFSKTHVLGFVYNGFKEGHGYYAGKHYYKYGYYK